MKYGKDVPARGSRTGENASSCSFLRAIAKRLAAEVGEAVSVHLMKDLVHILRSLGLYRQLQGADKGF